MLYQGRAEGSLLFVRPIAEEENGQRAHLTGPGRTHDKNAELAHLGRILQIFQVDIDIKWGFSVGNIEGHLQKSRRVL